MIQAQKRIVLYQPQQVNESLGLPSSKDMLPLEMLAIAAWPLEDGYEVQIIDGSLYSPEEAQRRVVEACAGALLYGTTGILGYMINDGLACTRAVKAAHPHLPSFIGGWFASVRPELQLGTGLYDAVVLGQGELTFRDVVRAVDCGEALEGIPGLALWREGEMIRTERRPVVGWDKLLNMPWHLIDIAPYRDHQMRATSCGDVLRMPAPFSMGERKPYFGITYFSSFGCPEPCTFCCSPEVTSRRWKAMPADRMLDDLEDLKQRWGFDVVRFHDANWGVMEKRSRAFAAGMLERGLDFSWNAFMETHSILRYDPSTLDLIAESGMYVAEIGAEAGTDEMMRKIGKPINGDDNITAAIEMDRRGIQGSITYIIGYPGEEPASMMATLDQCRRLHVACPLARPTVWPYRPIPGTVMWDEALELGYQPPRKLEEFGSIGEYHMEETWPGKIPPHVATARKMYQHYVTLDYGLARGMIGFWEKRAGKRLERGDYHSNGARVEAKAFDLCNRLARKLRPRAELSRSWVDPGHKTGSSSRNDRDSTDATEPASRA
jgi:radical SAM superfamily enzyme YgiQ (UPF0313 family)